MSKGRIASMMAFAFFLVTAPNEAAADDTSNALTSLAAVPAVTYIKQGWNPEDRQAFYHTSAGTQVIPYDWFMALEQSENTDLFRADHYLSLYRLIPGTQDNIYNPNELPLAVGFTESSGAQINPPHLGITCAFCHTGQLNYKGRTVFIDGGASMQYNYRFLRALIASLRVTLADRAKFSRFAARALKTGNKENNVLNQEELRKAVGKVTDGLVSRASPDIVEWGFGRFDALGRGSNLVFSNLDPDNMRHADAPVSIPQVWNAWQYDWVQWSGSIENPLARNIAQVIGVGAGLTFTDPGDRFRSSTDVDRLERLEQYVRQLKPPIWPQEIFGKIDHGLAETGKNLYGQWCAHCHVPGYGQPDKGIVQTAFGKQLHITPFPAEEIRTDPAYLENFGTRTVETGLGLGLIDAAKATEYLTTQIMKRAGRDIGPNNWWARPVYLARPHAGVWATPPFLHNGSIPNLDQLLSPMEQRAECFYVGNLEFDPAKVGFEMRACDSKSRPDDPKSGFEFDTAKRGNSNAGHEFRKDDRAGHAFTPRECEDFKNGAKNGVLGCELSEDGRKAIIEYLKTCDLDDLMNHPFDPDKPPAICQAEYEPKRVSIVIRGNEKTSAQVDKAVGY